MVHVSVIGCGHLGSAVIRGLARSGTHEITACDVSEAALAGVSEAADRTTTDLATAAEADVVVLAVKPGTVGAVLDELPLSSDQTLLSFAAAVPVEFLESRTQATVIRGMPNLAAETGTMACAVTPEATADVAALLADLGEFVEIAEAQMDIATAVNGSGPAFVFYLIKALAAAGVESGLDEADARVLAAQTFKGAAETVLQSEETLESLIDAVSSEGGTTIEGMEVLWDSDVDTVLGDAVRAAEDRSIEISREFQHD
ncbi:pyrroline-5-carboxylate reductase [Halodesulfurarchaeum sp. HSR-GB]|uniref:pyrroline-5-carboxylate reductase n=1 Tax=Halodesulfurarchaeum sp. HSR-GB TaxID=3074077 RepID=UPI00286026BC|nr:pyrroline-5-carboxylate reductase [Halodesulfurarchaeum sp. HSR-GB]MDR5657171.1 pyrroline-5-carboxylate reductase [Halodesulfurarchaeum sp. HSR-GB]